MGEIAIQVAGGKRLARALIRASAATDTELQRAVRDTANRSVVIFRGQAPRRTGRLHRGIAAHIRGNSALVTAHARNPETGYDYVGVTRFGHRVARIRPKTAGALAFQIGGRTIIRASVRGYRPKQDWADRALPAIALYARGALRGAGERILRAV